MVPEELPEMGMGEIKGVEIERKRGLRLGVNPMKLVTGVGRHTDILLKSDRQAGNSPGPAGSI